MIAYTRTTIGAKEEKTNVQISLDAVYNSDSGSSYKVYTNVIDSDITDYEAYSYAEQYCESLRGHLATTASEEENDFIYVYITSEGVESAYFGFSDYEEEGIWK